jgi:long-chain acyl-CoA synthetase
MNLARHLIRSAILYPELPAIYLGKTVFSTYRELAEKSRRLAGALTREFGLVPGDHVALILKNCPEFVELLYAIWHAGLVAVPVNPKLHIKELAFILENSESRVCFATPDLAPIVADVALKISTLDRVIATGGTEYAHLSQKEEVGMVERMPGDPAWIFYTSGTTGRPKGAVLSHRNLLTMTAGYSIDFEPVSTADRLLHLGPMCHGSGLYLMTRVAAGGAQVIPESAGFEPEEVFELLDTHSSLSFFAAPTIVNRLVASPRARKAKLENLRTIVYGGAPMYVEDMKRALATFGPRFAQVYGQGETPMVISVLPKALHADDGHPDFDARLASVGLPQSVVQVRIAGPDGKAAMPGEIGEVLVCGDTIMSGYWKNPEATASTLKNGWLHTGDVGIMDSNGFITLKDRSKDVIISGGSNIYPREVEEVLLRHPSVAEVSVIGQKDEEWGEAVVAFVACLPGSVVTSAELDQLCLDNIARYKRPKTYKFVDNLPKSHIGKILKTELRESLSGSNRQ